MSDSAPNIPLESAQAYRQAYDWLFARLPEDARAKVLEAKTDPNKKDKVVTDFVRRVIAMAEAGQ